MTNEFAIECIKDFKKSFGIYTYDADIKELIVALDMAIKALEQQPCEDTEVIKVSKGAVKSRQGRFVIYDVEWLKENFYSTEEKIYGQPKQPSEDCISREKAKQFLYERVDRLNDDELYDIFSRIIDDMYNELPPVTPQRPKGEWIKYEVDVAPHPLHCSLCGFSNHHISNRYMKEFRRCPNCGAEMNGGEEDEVD